jgi:glycosyltransferase involved in cell wall biosynthesis
MATRKSRRVKFLFVDSSRLGWGTEQHFVELTCALHDAGHELRVVVRRGSGVDELLANRGIPRHSTPFRGGGDPRGLWKVAQVIRDFRPDWIVTSRAKLYWPVVIMGLSMGVRVALFRHLTYFKHWHERQLLPRLADRFYVVSEFGREVLAREGVPAERMVRLYNPINVRRFCPLDPQERARIRAELGFAAGDVIAGFVGRMELSKGVGTLREALTIAMGRLSELKMLWIGDGQARADTEKFATLRGHGARQLFVGSKLHVEKYIGILDLLIAPSLAPETFGRVVAEAQACGIPVLASAAGGLAETFEPERTGLLLDSPADPASLADAIELLVRDAPMRARLGAAGVDFVRARFAAERIAAAFVENLSAAPTTSPIWPRDQDAVSHLVSRQLHAPQRSVAPPLLPASPSLTNG